METRKVGDSGGDGETEDRAGLIAQALGPSVNLTEANSYHGNASELRACAWLLDRGCEVFRNVRGHGPVDIIAIKDGKVHLFDVKHKQGTLTSQQAMLGVSLLIGDGKGGFEVVGASEKVFRRMKAKWHISQVRRLK